MPVGRGLAARRNSQSAHELTAVRVTKMPRTGRPHGSGMPERIRESEKPA